MTDSPPRRAWYRRPTIAVSLGAFALAVGVAAAVVSTRGGESPRAAPSERVVNGDAGLLIVGEDIQPGTYQSVGNTHGTCAWYRLRYPRAEPDAVISGGNDMGSSVVTVKAGDRAFHTSGCEDWRAVDLAAVKSASNGATTVDGSAGTLLVGKDISPGTYLSAGNPVSRRCFWARLQDLDNGPESVIAMIDHATGDTTAVIKSIDVAFRTFDCVDWKKID